MNIVEKKLSELTPYENNPRLNDEAVPYVKSSIETFGFKVPLVIDSDGVIIAGHTRFKAAAELGMESVPCIIADDLTEEQIRAFRLADNKVSEIARWDFNKLNTELFDLETFPMETFGFEEQYQSEQAAVPTDDDEYEEQIPVNPKSKYGEIYILGEHKVMCGDCVKKEDWERLMGDERADMCFTDPPYNVAIGSKNAFLNSVQKAGRCTEDIANDKGMSDEEIGETLWKPAFINMRDFSKDCCSLYVTMPQGGTHMMMMMMMIAEANWQVKHELMWLKNAPTFSMGRLDYDYQHEPILYGWNKTHKFYNGGEQNKSVWQFDKPRKCDLHPTMKPVPLVANAILNSSKAKDVVIDGFGGSGTTLIACEKTSRKARIMELDPKYVDVIIDRWEKLTGEKAKKVV